MADNEGYKTIGELAAEANGAIAIGPFGSAMKADTYTESGVRVIRGTNFGDTGTWKGDWVFVPDEFVDKMPRCEVRAGDLVFPHRGSIGEVAIVPDDGHRYCLSTSLMKVTLDPHKADPLFVCYYLKSPDGRQEIMRFGSQVGTPGIGQPLASLRQFNVPNPDLTTQRDIVAVLSTLDDKIALNRRINETLDSIAQAIFRDWFVTFGPVRRKSEGITDPVVIMGGLIPDPNRAAELAALFPASFGNDGLPAGWAEIEIGDLVKPQGGSTPSTKDEALWSPGQHYWATPKDLSTMSDLALFETARQISDAGLNKITSGLLPAGAVLLSSRAPIGYLAISQVPVAINQGFIGLVPTEEVGSSYLYCWCKANMDKIMANANGSTFQEISKKNFRPIPTPLPKKLQIISEFDRVTDPLFRRLIAGAKESRTLVEARDYLLPRLMSGSVRIAACEQERG